eukprot:3718856-Prymnesium_polylepis.1
MLLMQDIKDAPEVVKAPPEASAGLGAVIEALMTRDMGKRLTLNQLRLHEWLTDHEKQPLPSQVRARRVHTRPPRSRPCRASPSRCSAVPPTPLRAMRYCAPSPRPSPPASSQPVMMIEVTAEEIEQAISNRKAIKVRPFATLPPRRRAS